MIQQPSFLDLVVRPALPGHANHVQLANYLIEREGEWIDGRDLAKVAGAYAWRTRVSECRTLLHLTIENRQRMASGFDGKRFKISEYRYVETR
jgi:hypothetical protein